MSRITNRDTPPRDAGSVDHRLTRLLDTPVFARVVPLLAPETLHQLIQHRGLDACGELVASASPAQLTSLLDLDVWRRAQPGRDEQLDVDRFGEWLEVLADTGPSIAARTVAALDKDLIIEGLSRYVRVLDPGIFEPIAQSDDELPDRDEAMREGDAIAVGKPEDHEYSYSGGLECEVAGYIVRGRRADAWDAIVTLLTALDAEHGDYFHAVMRGCRQLSHSRPEIDGLDDLLLAPEQHLHEVAMERERRRSQSGYATPADARAFLAMARQPPATRREASVTGSAAINPIVAAYFRAADEAPESSNPAAQGPEPTDESPPRSPSASKSLPPEPAHPSEVVADSTSRPPGADVAPRADVTGSLEAVIELLTEAGLIPGPPRALLGAADADPQAARLTRLRRLMAHVRDTDGTTYLTRSRELAFLANALLAGCSVLSRPFTPQEASDAAASICNLGLESWPTRRPGAVPANAPAPRAPDPAVADDAFLVDHDLVAAFAVGWSVLHQEVSLFVADQLASTLADLHCRDAETRRGLRTLRRTLAMQRKSGKPWLARDATDVLAMIDMTTWISVRGLLDECPILPAALTAILERRKTPVSPTAFTFISTTTQIADVRLFMQRLPDLLAG